MKIIIKISLILLFISIFVSALTSVIDKKVKKEVKLFIPTGYTSIQEYVLEQTKQEQENLGASVQPAGLFTYRLSGSGISSSATSFSLNSLTLPQNDYPIQDSDVSNTFYMTLEPGSKTKQEFISCTTIGANTGSSVSISGCTRGLAPITPYTASTTLQFAHSGGSAVIFADAPGLFNQYTAKANDEAITGLWNFNSYLPTSSITATTSAQFATKGYADNLTNQGAATSSESIAGIIEQATQIEMASSTPFDANNPHTINSEYATSTPDGTSQAGLYVPVSKNNGKLHQLWLDLTEAFTWTGLHTFTSGFLSTASSTMSATTTISASNALSNALILNNVQYAFPSTQGASSTVLATNGSGSLTWNSLGSLGLGKATTTGSVTVSNSVASDSDTINFGFRPRQATINIDATSSGCTVNTGTKGQIIYTDGPNNTEGQYYGWRIGANSADSEEADTVLYSEFAPISNDGFTVDTAGANLVDSKIEINNVTSTGFDIVATRTDTAGSGCSTEYSYNAQAIQ